jgi:hypothetical protein
MSVRPHDFNRNSLYDKLPFSPAIEGHDPRCPAILPLSTRERPMIDPFRCDCGTTKLQLEKKGLTE